MRMGARVSAPYRLRAKVTSDLTLLHRLRVMPMAAMSAFLIRSRNTGKVAFNCSVPLTTSANFRIEEQRFRFLWRSSSTSFSTRAMRPSRVKVRLNRDPFMLISFDHEITYNDVLSMDNEVIMMTSVDNSPQ